jgi:4-hydroxybenzoate polyprenyltransferase
MRVNQWTKNAVVAAAFFFALGDRAQGVSLLPAAGLTALAVLAFCLISSAVYVFNDLRDRAADRRHPEKRDRPIAAGRVGVGTAATLAVVLVAGGGALALRVGLGFAAAAAAYVALQAVYSLWLKRIPLLDVMLIAIGFAIRAVAGAVALAVDVSPWLLLCAFLLALFLAVCKRRHEREWVGDGGAEQRDVLQRYDLRLLDQLAGITAATTILAYAMYTLSPATVDKFHTRWLGVTIPFVMFGIFRYMDLVYRHRQGDRPERIVLNDAPTLINLALFGATVLAVFFLSAHAGG